MFKIKTTAIAEGDLIQINNKNVDEISTACIGDNSEICFECVNKLGDEKYGFLLLDGNIITNIELWDIVMYTGVEAKNRTATLFSSGKAKALSYTKSLADVTNVINTIRVDVEEKENYVQVFYIIPTTINLALEIKIPEVNPQKTGSTIYSIELLIAVVNRLELYKLQVKIKNEISGNCNYDMSIYGANMPTSTLIHTQQKCTLIIQGKRYYMNGLSKKQHLEVENKLALGSLPLTKEDNLISSDSSFSTISRTSLAIVEGHNMPVQGEATRVRPEFLNVKYIGLVSKGYTTGVSDGGPIELICTFMYDIDRCVSTEEELFSEG